jgi:hypothetical protein
MSHPFNHVFYSPGDQIVVLPVFRSLSLLRSVQWAQQLRSASHLSPHLGGLKEPTFGGFEGFVCYAVICTFKLIILPNFCLLCCLLLMLKV